MIQEANRYTITDSSDDSTQTMSLDKIKTYIYGKIYRDTEHIIEHLNDGGFYLIGTCKIELDLNEYYSLENNTVVGSEYL